MSEKQGCSTVVVVMIALVMLVVGAMAGAAGLFFFYVPTQTTEVTAVPADVTTDVPANPATAKADYALLYPIEESLRVEGKLPMASVTNMVKNKRFEMRKCYQTALDRNPDLKGEMSLQFTVSGDTGKVVAAVERHTDIGDPEVKKCILGEIKTWELAASKAGDSVVKFDVLMIPISSASGDLK